MAVGDIRKPPVLSARQNAILALARDHGEVQVDPLALDFDVTPQTIRRDLNELCRLRLLQRVHGGAVAQDGVQNLGYSARKSLATDEKAAIGRRAASLIPNDASVIINIGTTTEQVAEHLVGHVGLLVITNSINVANRLRTLDNIRVQMAGGLLRREDGGIVGDNAVEFINLFKADYAVIGASAIEEDGSVLDFDMREVRVTQAIVRNARSTILVADSLKFQRQAPVRIGTVSDLEYFVTDEEPPAAFTDICKRDGVNIELASVE